MTNDNIFILKSALLCMRDKSPHLIVQTQMKDAIADVRRAQTLLEKAQRKLNWAKNYKPEGKTLCEVLKTPISAE